MVKKIFGGLSVLAVLASAPAFAYQVTGPVVELTDSKIVVQKGKEKWEIARDPSTKLEGDVKVGSKVTVQYNMTASAIESKSAPAKHSKK